MPNLISVYDVPLSVAARVLYDLLLERPPEANISHSKMPSYEDHVAFIVSRPYLVWCLIQDSTTFYWVGAVAITKADEIAVAIFKSHQREAYATSAIQTLRRDYPRPLLANVAPNNAPSHALFLKLGGEVIQHTYRLGERP